MPKHVFHCGLSDIQRQDYEDAQVLSLDPVYGNLTLKLDALRKVLASAEPERLTDFVEIASYAFAADRNTKRGTEILKNMGDVWRREFLLAIAVRDLAFWNRPETKLALTKTLGFASEDTWDFDFLPNSCPIPLQQYLKLVEHDADRGGRASIVLFSGGLDSLAGAVHELQVTNRHVVLVSHRSTPWIGKRQTELAKRLQEAYPRRITHVVVDNKMKAGLDEGREETQRTRSFFFLAMAAVAAVIERSDRIHFFENGIMSVNLPIAAHVVGARASRSTHPKTLHLFNRLLKLVTGAEVVVDNPFIWLTKAEVVQKLSESSERQLITLSFSCSHSRTASTFKPHCGTCIQCIQRRIATLGAGADDVDEADGYETDLFRSPLENGEDRAMVVGAVSLALECARIDPRHFLGRFAGEISQIVQPYLPAERDEAARRTVELFRRHGDTVRGILATAVRTHAEAFVDQTLPPSSLLALIGQGNIADTGNPTLPVAPVRSADDLGDGRPPVASTSSGICIAIDESRHRIEIHGIASLSGSAIFPIVRRLAEMARIDQTNGLHPANRQGRIGKLLAQDVGLSSEDDVRSAIARARKDIIEGFAALDGTTLESNAVIENVHGKGYRLNPSVLVISLDQMKKL